MSSSRVVRTQAELDEALADKVAWIEILSEHGVWIEVTATGSATVTATGSATVRATDSATVRATPKVAVHLHSASVKVSGGVVIDVSKPLTDAAEWCEYHGVTVSKAGVATLYKAVNDEWTTDRGTSYAPRAKPSAPDWRDDDSCGGGLHFGPTPVHALAYHPDATRYVEVGVKVADLRVIPGGTAKCKAREWCAPAERSTSTA